MSNNNYKLPIYLCKSTFCKRRNLFRPFGENENLFEIKYFDWAYLRLKQTPVVWYNFGREQSLSDAVKIIVLYAIRYVH